MNPPNITYTDIREGRVVRIDGVKVAVWTWSQVARGIGEYAVFTDTRKAA